ncbi:MAG: hydrogenase accessory protein HypB, partial [Gammaproteobacteria bacterium]|nr:hydrogenase accessory protein HypB [Gammaproteobacteria bacterium]
DLLTVLDDFETGYATNCLRELASQAPLLEVSAKSGAGCDAWLDWIRSQRASVRNQQASAVRSSEALA